MNIAICKENRVYYFDYLRVLACISVIFMHTAADTSANTWGIIYQQVLPL